ncbi:MAG: polymerase sigma factor, sigma-70 family [Bacillales bacterium]|nr:polymerase sigma factor, sigma-70 family [Bacillales bacterium]
MANTILNTDLSIEEVLQTYANMVYRIAFSRAGNAADADDILQEVFIKYIKTKTIFTDEEHRKAWLIKASVHQSISLLKYAWFRRTVPLDDKIHADLKEKSDVYLNVLELPVKYRIVVHLFYFEDLSIRQIGELLEKNESTIKTQLQRSRELLREKLKGDVDFV